MAFIKKEQAIAEMMDYCVEKDVTNFADLFSYCSKEKYNWFRHICNEDVARIMVDFINDRQAHK